MISSWLAARVELVPFPIPAQKGTFLRPRSIIVRGIVMTLTVIHPGEHLAEELKTFDMSAAELAREIRVPTNRVTQILNGTRAITGDTALRLGHFFGTSAEFWLNLQSLYELRLAQRKVGKSIRALPRLERRELVCA
jgi:antitoxin HigA-1